MKIRFPLFALAALTTLSVSALVPTQASAWGMAGGYGGGYHYGVGNSTGYFRPSFYRPQVWNYAPAPPDYRRAVVYSTPAYAPAPIVTNISAPQVSYQQSYNPQTTYIAQPAATPCSGGAASAAQVYSPAPQQQAYAPQQQLQAPSLQQPAQDNNRPAIYSSTELQK